MKKLSLIICCLLASLIVRAELLPYPTTEHEGTVCYVYPVEKSIGLYRISLNFSVPQQTIIKFNPQLKTRGLHYGETLLIPVNERDLQEARAAMYRTSEPPVATVEETPTKRTEAEPVSRLDKRQKETENAYGIHRRETEDSPNNRIDVQARLYAEMDTLRIGLLLPLYANTAERTLAMDRFVDFYEGVLLAVYDAQASGVTIALHVFDTEKGVNTINNIVAKHELTRMQGILGPAYPNQVDAIAHFVERYQIPTLIPFTDQVRDIDSNPYLMQFNAPVADEAKALVQELSKDTLVNWIFVEGEERDLPESVRAIRREVLARGLHHTTTTVHRILTDSLHTDMLKGKENVLVLNTEKYANARLMMSHIAASAEGQLLTLVSQYSWQKERILVPQVYATEFATDAEADLTHYNSNYAKYFGHEHAGDLPRYDLLGYDMMNELIAHILNSGRKKGLQSDADFQRVYGEEGGYKNTNIHVVRK